MPPSNEVKSVINILPMIIKCQSIFRQKLACKRAAKRAEELKEKVAQRRLAQKTNPELAVLTEFVTQLSAKNVTPEAFFRICDRAYARRISKQDFKDGLKLLNLRFTPS